MGYSLPTQKKKKKTKQKLNLLPTASNINIHTSTYSIISVYTERDDIYKAIDDYDDDDEETLRIQLPLQQKLQIYTKVIQRHIHFHIQFFLFYRIRI